MNVSAAAAVFLGLATLTSPAFDSPALTGWWEGETGTGNWWGTRTTLEDRGLTLSGKWGGTVYGVVAGGVERHGAFDEALHFDLKVDFAKLTQWSALDGLTAAAGVRYRDGFNVNEYVGASAAFNPSVYQSGKGWRLMPFSLTYTTPELFGIKKLLTLSGGWLNPYEVFAQQPEAKFFRNNVIFSSKGISANGIGWSSSYAGWGGFLKVRPCDWHYAQAGLYLAIPGGANTANHGLDLQGARPANRNGWFIVAESGVTPKWGPAALPGKYAVGGYYWGLPATAYDGVASDGRYGVYLQAEQMVWREPSAAPPPRPGGKNPAAPELSEQGLHVFSFFNFAAPNANPLPFYFHTGLTYTGLLPGRDADRCGVVFGLGSYSYEKIQDDYRDGREVHQTYEGVLEADYRIQVNRWASVQPFVQYLLRPNGTGLVANATVLGVHFAVEF